MSLKPIYLLTFCMVFAWLPPAAHGDETTGAKYQLRDIGGSWTYRSFHNDPAPVGGDAQKALALIFAEATFTFSHATDGSFTGAIDWSGGGLDLRGTMLRGGGGIEFAFSIVGTGRAGTQTEGWRYDYFGELAHEWPNGVNQTPALVGSVIRVNPHDGAPAGYVASFIAVRQRP